VVESERRQGPGHGNNCPCPKRKEPNPRGVNAQRFVISEDHVVQISVWIVLMRSSDEIGNRSDLEFGIFPSDFQLTTTCVVHRKACRNPTCRPVHRDGTQSPKAQIGKREEEECCNRPSNGVPHFSLRTIVENVKGQEASAATHRRTQEGNSGWPDWSYVQDQVCRRRSYATREEVWTQAAPVGKRSCKFLKAVLPRHGPHLIGRTCRPPLTMSTLGKYFVFAGVVTLKT